MALRARSAGLQAHYSVGCAAVSWSRLAVAVMILAAKKVRAHSRR